MLTGIPEKCEIGKVLDSLAKLGDSHYKDDDQCNVRLIESLKAAKLEEIKDKVILENIEKAFQMV